VLILNSIKLCLNKVCVKEDAYFIMAQRLQDWAQQQSE
jgi:hypothetical protein